MGAGLFEMDEGDPRLAPFDSQLHPKLAAGPAGRAYTEEHFTRGK